MRIQQFNRGEDESHLRRNTVDQKMPAAGCTYSPCHEPLEKVALELEQWPKLSTSWKMTCISFQKSSIKSDVSNYHSTFDNIDASETAT